MGVPGKGTSSIFLLLAFNIGYIFCQNVGQECSFAVPHHGEVYNEYNPGIANMQPPKKNIRFYPANRPPTGPSGAAECQKPPPQENVHPTLNQQTLSSLEPGPNFVQANKQPRSDLSCSNESNNGEGAPPPYSEQLLNTKPCPKPPITPCAPQNPTQFEAFPQGPFQLQPFSHGTARGVFSPLSFTNPDRSVQTPVNDVECPQQNPSLSSNNAFTSLSVPMLRKFFTPLVPYSNARLALPCADTQPSLFPQGPSVPIEPLNDQVCLVNQVDVLPLQQSRETITREQDNPMINYSPLSLEPKQILPSPPVICLPKSPVTQPCDTLPESQPCSSIPPGSSSIDPFHDSSSLSTCDQCKVTRSLCSCPVSSCQSCQPACHCSVCDDEPSLFQIQTSLQLPHNIPSCVCSENCSPHPYSDFNPSISLNSGCCSYTNNAFCIPQPCCAPQSCCVTQSCETPNNCFDHSHPQLSCDYSPPCSACAMPTSTPVCRPSCEESPCHTPEPMFCMPQPCCAHQSCCVTQTCGTPNNCFGASRPQLSSDCSPPCSACALSSPVCLPSCESPCHSPEPINVQINVPPPIIPAPSITIINTPPETAPTSIDSGYFDTSPMIIDSRRRRSKSWLPLLLVWLFSCDGF